MVCTRNGDQSLSPLGLDWPGSVVICVWVFLQWESALCCMIITILTCRTIWKNYKRVQQRFDFDENDTVDFRDFFEGPAAIQAIPMIRSVWNRTGGTLVTTKSDSSFRSNSNHFKKTSSLPVPTGNAFDDDGSSNSDWNKGRERLVDRRQRNDYMKRRGRSISPPENYIQTV